MLYQLSALLTFNSLVEASVVDRANAGDVGALTEWQEKYGEDHHGHWDIFNVTHYKLDHVDAGDGTVVDTIYFGRNGALDELFEEEGFGKPEARLNAHLEALHSQSKGDPADASSPKAQEEPSVFLPIIAIYKRFQAFWAAVV